MVHNRSYRRTIGRWGSPGCLTTATEPAVREGSVQDLKASVEAGKRPLRQGVLSGGICGLTKPHDNTPLGSRDEDFGNDYRALWRRDRGSPGTWLGPL